MRENQAMTHPKLHYLQHVDAEDLAHIATWAERQGFEISATRLHRGETLPAIDAIDWLIVMGGPMNIYEESEHPWLVEEKRFIRTAIDANKVVAGMCLGAQLIADVLGAKITRNPHTEIGWFPIRRSQAANDLPLLEGLPETITAFHWHGDRFAIPQGAIPIYESDACAQQGFVYGDRVLALQCHLEETDESVEHLIANFEHEMVSGPYVQTVAEVRNGCTAIPAMHDALETMLDRLPK